MNKFETEIRRLGRALPSKAFTTSTKRRLMDHIRLNSNETWFLALLKKVGVVRPSAQFLKLARMRLMYRIAQKRESMFTFWVVTKRVLASTMVLIFAVTSTLFFVDGKQYVSAANETYLEVLTGSVTVKHADKLAWDAIASRTDVAEGDLIRVDDGSEAVVRFFDDSELRLAENSLVLLNKINISEGYSRQGDIQVFLHQGQAWLQTLNVDDGFANFTVITPDAIVSSYHGSFDIQTAFNNPTVVRSLKYGANVNVINRDTQKVVSTGRIVAGQVFYINSAIGTASSVKFSKLVDSTKLTKADYADEWVVRNLARDQKHLAFLREREVETLRAAAGVLPGEMLYPIKLAKERLKLSFSFGQEALTQNQIAIANERLQEAMVLIQKGETAKAKEALVAYQISARLIAQEARNDESVKTDLENKFLASHEKALVAALPSDVQAGLIRNALNQTEVLMANGVVDRERVRLEHDQERLLLIQDLVMSGDIDTAKDLLVNRELNGSKLLAKANKIKDEEQKKALLNTVLDARNEELRLIESIANTVARQQVYDYQFVALLEAANKGTKAEIKSTVDLVQPLDPDVVIQPVSLSSIEKKVRYFVEKINIYKSWTGQRNQIVRLFKLNPLHARDMNFLIKLRDQLDGRAREYINVKILKLSRQKSVTKGKEVKRRIEQSKKLR